MNRLLIITSDITQTNPLSYCNVQQTVKCLYLDQDFLILLGGTERL